MKRLLMVLGTVAALSACSNSNSPSPTSDPNVARFTADLLASNEVPPTAGAEANARGVATITFNLVRDAGGNLSSATATFEVTLSGFPSTSQINIAHIHPGRAGISGPVLVSTTLAAGEVTLSSTGTGQFTKTNVPLTVTNAQAIMADPAGYYFNVHTAANPTGAIRGQLTRTQ
jgi:hypothetical protein